MRKFADIQRELGLHKFLDSANGTLYYVPSAPGAPRLMVRHFDRALSPSFVEPYARMMAAAAAWLVADPMLTSLVRVDLPIEIGDDFIAVRHWNATALNAFLETDPEEDPPEAPPELARMQERFRERVAREARPREALLATILSRSILQRTYKTFWVDDPDQFVIADLSPTRDEMERWRALDI